MNTYWKFGAIVAVIIGVLVWLAMGGSHRKQDVLQRNQRSRADGRSGPGRTACA